jgi:hypothetical protein
VDTVPGPPAPPAPRPRTGGQPGGRGVGIDPALFRKIIEDIDWRVFRNDGKKGRVSVSLAWDNQNDLDLVVVTDDAEIYHGNKQSHCGGTLDVDSNFVAPYTNKPVENIVWPDGRKPRGALKIYVSHYKERASEGRPARPTQYRIVVRDGGPTPRIYRGEISHDPSAPTKRVFVAEVPIQ